MTNILVTGADGFVGRALSVRLRSAGHDVLRIVRAQSADDAIAIGDIAEYAQWYSLLDGIDVVVHLAARAHVQREKLIDPLKEFRRVNVAATLQLARAAAKAGVSRFVFLSSIGVNGVATADRAFCELDEPNPIEPYAISKWEAERGLLKMSAQTDLEVVRVRPPLVVGAGAKGNLFRLIKLVDSGLPLPLGAIHNLRSFISIEDLCELLSLCITDERAADELFLAANPEVLSTTDVLRAIATGLGRTPRLVPVPLRLLRLAARYVGAGAELKRLTSSLQVNSDHAAQVLFWRSHMDIRASVAAMARSYQRERGLFRRDQQHSLRTNNRGDE